MNTNKISFTVTLDEFYMDEDSNGIDNDLTKFIKDQVVYQIWEKIKTKVEDQIQRDVKNTIEQEFIKKIQIHISDIVSSNQPILKGVDGYNDNGQYVKKDMSIEEYIRDKFKRDSGWASPNETIKKLAEKFAVEMKQRYDILFASQIVNKLHEQGLLKDDAIQSLLAK